MPKKKDGKAPKLPKRIAGIKVPKELRKTGGRLLAEASAPATRELLLGALATGARALSEATAKPARSSAPEPGAAAKPEDRIAPLVGLAASALAGWLGQAARPAAPSQPNAAPPQPTGPAKPH